jgi:Glycosyltransferases involved in cell wall biogenesis
MTNRNDPPAVSVIIPTYNRAHTISQSIISILNQTYNNFELIIVDDGSTDNTEEVVKNFNDKRIKYIAHKENRGAASALNTGISFSSGSFVTFNGSDDEWLPEKLEEEMKGFKTSDSKVGVVYSALWEIYNNKKVYTPRSTCEVLEGNLHDELIKVIL